MLEHNDKTIHCTDSRVVPSQKHTHGTAQNDEMSLIKPFDSTFTMVTFIKNESNESNLKRVLIN